MNLPLTDQQHGLLMSILGKELGEAARQEDEATSQVDRERFYHHKIRVKELSIIAGSANK